MRVLKQIVHSSLRKLGYRIVRIEPGENGDKSGRLGPFLAALQGQGFAPQHIVDVGANRGLWTREALRFFPDATYTLVEPQDQLKKYVQDLIEKGSKIRWVNAGAGDRAGTMMLAVSHRDDSSTFDMTEEQARQAGMQQIPVAVRTLNEMVASLGGPVPEMVKIDAEGFDLKVLAGATELLGKTDVFLVEATVCSSSENTAAKVIERMSAAGYRLLDITDLNRSPKYGVLWLCELAFLRNGSHLLDGVRSYE
jgi:FkbM family methyltransferase